MTRSPTYRLLAALAAVASLAIWPSVAHADDGQSLLQRYQPVTVMDGQELFTPTDVGSFVQDAVLETQTAPNVWTVADADPEIGNLPTKPTQACIDQGLDPCYRLNQPDCSPAAGPAGLSCYVNAWQDPSPASVVYGRKVERGDTTLLQYWYFSYDDLYSYMYPPDDTIWQDHEGDWEMVSVLLRHGKPVEAGYSQHCTGERRAWADVNTYNSTTHPIVYVANGSHANLFAPREHPIALQCIPAQAIQLLNLLGLPMPNDHAYPGNVVMGPGGLAGVTPTQVVDVTEDSPRWMRFAGVFGELQMFHAPPQYGGTVPSGYSPPSPRHQDTWKHPLATLHSWPLV